MKNISSTAKIPTYAVEVVVALKNGGHKAYLVGGCVRDMLMGRVPHDFDVATSAQPSQVVAAFKRVIPTGIDHGTVTVMQGDDKVEVTTFRGDGDYTDGRRPDSVKFVDSIEADLARRDFTMNAIAYDPYDDVLVDPFGGREDIKAKLVRCVGDPMDRFTEDGLRPLRAVRFAAVLGFNIHPDTKNAIRDPKVLETYRKVATERVMVEFEKILTSPTEGAIKSDLFDFVALGLADARFGRLGTLPKDRLVRYLDAVHEVPPNFALRFTMLHYLCPLFDEKCPDTLKLPTAFIRRVLHLINFMTIIDSTCTDSYLRQLASKAGVENIDDVLTLQAALVDSAEQRTGASSGDWFMTAARLKAILKTNPPLTLKDLALDGNEVMAIVGKGKIVGVAMQRMLSVVLDDPSYNTKEKLTSLAEQIAQVEQHPVKFL